MKYVIVDVEATCWEDKKPGRRNEIIEIGSVILNPATLDVESEFTRFIKPVVNPDLSEFCMRLTTIRQSQIDHAEKFKIVFDEYMAWIGPGDATICSWGAYDRKQFESDCRLHGVDFPEILATRHLNLKSAFARLRGIKRCGMAAALEILGIALLGQHHRGIDDARNIARIAKYVLPQLENHNQNA